MTIRQLHLILTHTYLNFLDFPFQSNAVVSSLEFLLQKLSNLVRAISSTSDANDRVAVEFVVDVVAVGSSVSSDTPQIGSTITYTVLAVLEDSLNGSSKLIPFVVESGSAVLDVAVAVIRVVVSLHCSDAPLAVNIVLSIDYIPIESLSSNNDISDVWNDLKIT